jgi:hypothetical protein
MRHHRGRCSLERQANYIVGTFIGGTFIGGTFIAGPA